MNETLVQAAERIYYAWDKALADNDMEAFIVLYHPDIIIESPLIPHFFHTKPGICEGTEALRKFVEMIVQRKPKKRNNYRTKFFTDGKTLMWEYPRATPFGEQMDFAEIMELEDGLIRYHRVYWGWYGVSMMQQDQYWS